MGENRKNQPSKGLARQIEPFLKNESPKIKDLLKLFKEMTGGWGTYYNWRLKRTVNGRIGELKECMSLFGKHWLKNTLASDTWVFKPYDDKLKFSHRVGIIELPDDTANTDTDPKWKEETKKKRANKKGNVFLRSAQEFRSKIQEENGKNKNSDETVGCWSRIKSWFW